MSNDIFRDRRRLPNDASLTDDPAAPGISAFPVVTSNDIVQGLVDRSGNPRQAMGARFGTDYLCSTCGLTPDQPAQDGGHPYAPIVGRTPGVHQDVDDGRVHNFAPAIDGPGQAQTDIDDPDLAPGGLAEQEFNAKSARHRAGTWPRDDAVLVDVRDVREGRYGPR